MLVSRSGLSPVMVGRDEELAVLRRLLGTPGRDRGDGPAVVMISGDAGVGKSRLLREALLATAPGTLVLAGQAEEGDLARPFELVRDALEPHTPLPAADAERSLLPMGAATATFTAVAFGVAALDGFDVRLPILAGTIAGLVVDWLLADRRSLPIVGLGGGLALSTSFLALQHAEHGVGWSPSLWSGAVVFATLVGYGAGVVLTERRSTA